MLRVEQKLSCVVCSGDHINLMDKAREVPKWEAERLINSTNIGNFQSFFCVAPSLEAKPSLCIRRENGDSLDTNLLSGV